MNVLLTLEIKGSKNGTHAKRRNDKIGKANLSVKRKEIRIHTATKSIEMVLRTI